MPSGITLISGIVTGAPVPLDAKFGPYNSVTDALNDLTSGLRHRGLTVGVLENGLLTEYWFKDGTANEDFIVKASGDASQGGNSFQPDPDVQSDELSSISLQAPPLGATSYFLPRVSYASGSFVYETGDAYGASPYRIAVTLDAGLNRWKAVQETCGFEDCTFLFEYTATSAATYPWQATWPAGVVVQKAPNPRLIAPLSANAADGTSIFAARADHVHPFPTATDVGAVTQAELTQQLATKADSTHTHLIYQVTGLQSSLDTIPVVASKTNADANAEFTVNGSVYAPVGTQNGKNAYDNLDDYYAAQTISTTPPRYVAYSGDRWRFVEPNEPLLNEEAAPGDELYPWLADWSGTSLSVVGPVTPDPKFPRPRPLGVASTGWSKFAAREDHVHKMPEIVAGPAFIYRYGGTDAGQNFENSGFVGPTNVGLADNAANGSPVGGYGFYGGWDDLEYTRLWVRPAQLFPDCSHFRVTALTKASSVWGDGLWTMVRYVNPSGLQITVPGLQAYGGLGGTAIPQPNAAQGIYTATSQDLLIADYPGPLTFIAYFAAYNNGNGGTIAQTQVVLHGVKL